jgi:thiol-disulfide isomerase/thioredoxin
MILKILFFVNLICGFLFCSPSDLQSNPEGFISLQMKGAVKHIPESKIKFLKRGNMSDSLRKFNSDTSLVKPGKIIKDDESGMPMLIGLCTREAFKDTNFYWWWMSEYDLYKVDSTRLSEIKAALKNVDIKIIMGTWCSDSRREVPRLFKIFDALNYPSNKVEIICVNEDKKTGGNELERLKIELVPTIIFYKGGNELGRIVEAPEDTLEKDMLKILSAHS